MLRRNARRTRHVLKVPAGSRTIRAIRGVGPMMPRVGTAIALLAKITVVGVAVGDSAVGMDAVIAFISTEPAFGDDPADVAVGIDAETSKAVEIRRYVTLADQQDIGAQRP